MRLEIIKTVFRKELREMLRDRRSLAVMFGVPLLLYPLVSIGIATLGASRKQELTDQQGHVALSDSQAAPHLIELIEAADSGLKLTTVANLVEALANGTLDALIVLPPGAQEKAVVGEKIQIEVRVNRSRSGAQFIEKRIDKLLDAYQQWIIKHRLASRGVPASVLEPIKVETVDIATGEQRFGRVLGHMLPLLLLLTGMLGALFPALNATTTERELGTLETLLVTPAGRTELLLAKSALILLCALLTAGLNMLSMSLVLLRSVSLVTGGLEQLRISPVSLLLTYVAAVPALIFFSAIVLIVGLLARNYREANSFATPVMLLPLASLAVGISEPAISPALLITPVANTTIIIREVLSGSVSVVAFVAAFASSCVYAGLMLSLAARIFSSEQLVNPAWEPLSMKGLRGGVRRAARRLPAVDEALVLFSICLLLLFYVSPSIMHKGLTVNLAVNELLLITAPVLLFAWLGKWNWRETFLWRMPSPTIVSAAILIGIGIAPWVNLLVGLQHSVWPRNPEMSRAMGELLLPPLASHPFLTITFVAVLAGVCEELLFRGAIQSAMIRRVPPWFAIAFTALLFGLIHMDFHGLAVRTLIGVLLGWLAWRSGSIMPAMIAHAIYDATQLAFAAWAVRAKSVTEVINAQPSLKLSWQDMVAMAAGAALIVLGCLLCRTAFRKHDQSAGVEAN